MARFTPVAAAGTVEECDPYRDAGLTPEEAARVRAAAGRDTWVTRDGRELSIKQMYRPHIGNAQAVLTTWIKREKDPEKKRELKRWRSKMRRELAKREKAWQAKRKKQRADGTAGADGRRLERD